MTRKDAFQQLLTMCFEHTADLNNLLLSVQGRIDQPDFDQMRRRVAQIMGEMLVVAINPTIVEFPDLKPPDLDL